jgi:predicted TIM-barrel fold metal-dependent hydrolase
MPLGNRSGPYRRSVLLRPALPTLRALRRIARPGPRLRDFAPASTLVLDAHPTPAARVSAIDVHAHLGRWLTPDGSWMAPDVHELVRILDAVNVQTVVNLDGRWGAELEENLDRYDRAYPDRFITFCHLNYELLEARDGPSALIRSLEDSVERGARGIKVWKDLGLRVRVNGERLFVDDARLAPVWDAAGALDLPVLIHTADPIAFFAPVDRYNERVEELIAHPSQSLATEGRAMFDRLLRAFEATVASHPTTTFIGAHVGCYAENLSYVSTLLDRYPNLYIDIGGRAPDLGRQPRAAARLIERHVDRVLFGSDLLPISAAGYGLYFRLLETDDEYFPYTPDGEAPPQGRWHISGLALGHESLERLYAENARRLLGLG